MAEIVLARILGPSGFQRPVVIKRILPHLARDPSFVGMFLDEARIVAGIRHPNVVQVHELGHEGTELFLVMEYLEGESVAGLSRRLRAKGEKLPYAIAAHIVAEAASGLHAAHDLTDPNGKPQNVVHRDVSPQNVFVGYGGAVKVLDFGVAIAADRMTRTEAGTFKGKFEYSSPEQARGRPLDRRSDVFALGVLLYEVSTGTRLFKRSGQLDTLRAICEEPIVPPTSIVPDYPEALSRVVMRALERRRSDRYQTAIEMRRDLVSVIRSLPDGIACDEDLAKLMNHLFADRIAEKTEMLRRVQVGATAEIEIPSVEVDDSVELPVAFGGENGSTHPPPELGSGTDTEQDLLTPEGATPFVMRTSLEPELPPPRKRPPYAIMAALGAGALLLAGMALIVAARSTRPSQAASNPSTELAQGASAAASASVEPGSASSAPAAPVAPAEVVVHVETTPPSAHVRVAGEDKGTSPLDLRLPRSTQAVAIDVVRDGFKPARESLVPDVDQRLKLTLVAAPVAGPTPAAAPQAPTTGKKIRRFD